jgi:hypothetical protein
MLSNGNTTIGYEQVYRCVQSEMIVAILSSSKSIQRNDYKMIVLAFAMWCLWIQIFRESFTSENYFVKLSNKNSDFAIRKLEI